MTKLKYLTSTLVGGIIDAMKNSKKLAAMTKLKLIEKITDLEEASIANTCQLGLPSGTRDVIRSSSRRV